MKIKQAKLAQALRGENSNLIDNQKYDLHFDKGMLHAGLKNNPKGVGPFIIFPANIAFLEVEEEKHAEKPVEVTLTPSQVGEQQLGKGKAKK